MASGSKKVCNLQQSYWHLVKHWRAGHSMEWNQNIGMKYGRCNCNCNYILFTKLPWPGDSEITFWSSSQAATCPSVYHTRWRQHCSFNCWTSSRAAVNTNFYSLWFDPMPEWNGRFQEWNGRQSSIGLLDRAKSTDHNKLTAKRRFRYSDFVTKWGFGQNGSGDSKNIFRIALFSQSALSAVSLLRLVVVDPTRLHAWYLQKNIYR